MTVTLKRQYLHGEIDVITSKSAAHRIMICAAAASRSVKIFGLNNSADVDATRRCLTALGARFKDTADGGCITEPIALSETKNNGESVILNCGESGSTLRFLLPFVSALGVTAEFHTEGRLSERPTDELIRLLTLHGADISKDGAVIKSRGALRAGEYTVSGKVSSQFTSGLLMALPLVKGKSAIIQDGAMASKGYIDITLGVLKKFGADITSDGGVYHIDGGKVYCAPESITVEGDWSNAAFFVVAGAAAGDITINGLDTESKQPDKEILTLIRRMGGDISVVDGRVRVGKSRLKGIEIDAENIPDIVPVLSVAAGTARGRTVIYNAGRLRLKESDRLETVAAMLNKCGGRAAIDGDKLIIDGVDSYRGAVVDSFNDHRIAMSAAVLSLSAQTPVTITNAEAVNKSYPDFFEKFKGLYGQD
ncbi:MAG: 3-phosphoshikimate 1-carboxyvinyltransferase [Clostridiales bacterium]|nr:3-phosphoshikimate 1-carboxyvinyltransferase [Clostridiales bacterium]